MRQILQSLRTGKIELLDVPVPSLQPKSLVVESRASVISAGTERTLVAFGRGGLLEKVRSQPEKVKQVLDKIRTDGFLPTLEAVKAKLDQPIPLGYCNAGVVQEVGRLVEGFRAGDRVVTNGPHAEYVQVPWTLAARIPDGVSFEAAAFAPLAAIGLQGFRLASPTLGETVVVYGLGLIGLLTVQIARAGGCRVIGIDTAADRLELARGFGATVLRAAPGTDLPAAVRDLTGGVGADAVLLTLASDSNGPAHLAAEMSRKRGRLVLVGVTGLDLERADFYEKELSLQVSCSYGPGRYDREHEEKAQDYPLPFVRWTEGRNFAAVLDLIADGRLDPVPMVTHRFALAEAVAAYDAVVASGNSLGVLLQYPDGVAQQVRARRVVGLERAGEPVRGNGVVGFVGAGNYASRVLIPAFARAGADLHTLVSSGGISSAVAGRLHCFRYVATDIASVFENPEIDTIVVATRHDTHADLAVRALEAGKHVWVEKPLALTHGQLETIEEAHARSARVLCVGFNRRFATLSLVGRSALTGRSGPLVLNILVNAGALPDKHWARDLASGGGRLVGEASHFVDLARFFVGCPITRMDVVGATDRGGKPIEDISVIQMSFLDGSISSIQYIANGPSRLPKERVELYWDGKGARIVNFVSLETWGVKTSWRWPARKHNKGQEGLAREFLKSVRAGSPPPIAADELFEVGRWVASLGGTGVRRVQEESL